MPESNLEIETERDAMPPATHPAEPAGADASNTVAAADTGWPADWRERAAGDDRRALKTLDRFADPGALWSSYRELRARVDGSRMVPLPDADAGPEARAELNAALGVPEKPEDYFDLVDLGEGEVLGEADRTVAEDFARALHPAGATPEVMSAALRWYLDNQESQQAELDTADAADREAGEAALGEMWGPSRQRMIAGIGALFADAPGGAAPEGGGLFARLMGGRMGDGRLVGNDPDMLAFLGGLAARVNPSATVTGGSGGAGTDIAQRLSEIEAMMQTGDATYWKDDAVQQEYRDLIEARSRLR